MDAIEIYSKILKAVKGENYQDVNTALSFAQNKVNEHYWNKRDGLNRTGGLLGAGYAQTLSPMAECAKQSADMAAYKVLED